MLGRTELLELLLRRARCSPGSVGCSPVNLANRLRISVKEMTPLSLPDMDAPAMADAGTDVARTAGDGTGDGGAPWWAAGTEPPEKPCGASNGVAGVDGDGEADSTTHMRWDLVATNLATVCASVE